MEKQLGKSHGSAPMTAAISSSAGRVESASSPRNVELSLVVPVFNESATLEPFLARTLPALDRLNVRYEIIFVNDGSTDDTLARLLERQRTSPAIRVVALSRNFGKEAATTAGLDHASGAAVVPIDCDLQDPPEIIAELLAKWREGFEVVVATRKSRDGETPLKRATAAAFYRLFNLIAVHPIPADTGDFRLLDRKAVRAVRCMPERIRFMKGLFAWVGFKQTAVFYDREPRLHGHSRWNYVRLWNLAVQGLASFSTLPLRVWTYLGAAWTALCLALGVVRGVAAVFSLAPFPGVGWQTLLLLLASGIQIMAIGVIGEYVACLLDEVKARPVYVVGKRYGFRRRRRQAADCGDAVLPLPDPSPEAETPRGGAAMQPPAAA